MIRGHIAKSKELNAFMLRHFNLYDSFYYSDYMVVVCRLWMDEGYKQLDQLIVKAGIPLQEAKQKFQYMKTDYKRHLVKSLSEAGQDHGLVDILFDSFVRQCDEEYQFSAFDIVGLMTTVLEHPRSL